MNRIHVVGDAINAQARTYAEYRVFSALTRHARKFRRVRIALRAGQHGTCDTVTCAVWVALQPTGCVRVKATQPHVYAAINRAIERLGEILGDQEREFGMRLNKSNRRSALPTTLPRTIKMTRDRTYNVPPPAHIRVLGGEVEDEAREDIARKLGMKLGKFGPSVERITVRVSDVNGPKGGRDQVCQIKVVLSGLPSVVIEETDSALQVAVDRAMKATARAVRRSVQRRQLKRLHHRASQVAF